MTPPVFARHETFHPRHGWVKKGFEAVCRDPEIFLREDAPVALGVGKNMARAIRYWCHSVKVLVDGPSRGRSKTSIPSVFGARLLGPSGLDPYLEEPGSLWLLHWALLRPPSTASSWDFAMFRYAKQEFSVSDLSAALVDFVKKEYPNSRVAPSSLHKDASCLVRMYGHMPSERLTEESIHCPFAELGLLRPVEGTRMYEFRYGPKRGLSHWLIVAAALDYAARIGSSRSTIAIGRLLRDAGAPGLAFRLTETDLYSAIERCSTESSKVNIEDTGGVIQLAFQSPPDNLAAEFIARHYDRTPPIGNAA